MNLKIKLSRMLAVCAVVALLPAAALAADARLTDLQRFASDGSEDAADDFGSRVAVSGDLMVVGTGLGEALVYRQQPGRTWAHEQTLTYVGSSTFGIDVATDGTKIAVLDSELGPKVFKETSTGWILENITFVNNSSRLFRRIDLVDGNLGSELIVTCIEDGTDPKILLFDWTYISGIGSWWWWLTQTISTPGGASSSFGKSVDLNPGRFLVGDPGSGRANMYEWFGGTSWGLTATLIPPATAPDNFGRAVALDGDLAVVSGTASNFDGDELGAALVFEPDDFSSGWNLVTELDPPSNYFSSFGADVAISGESIVVTSPGSSLFSIGSMGYATLYCQRSTDWESLVALRSSYFSVQTLNYFLGQSVALTDNTVVLGADGGETIMGTSKPGKVHAYDIDVTQAKFWSGAEGNAIGDDDNWDGDGGSDGFFTSYGSAEEYHVVMDGSTWLNEFVVRLPTRFDLNGLNSTVGDEFSDRDALSVYGTGASSGAAVCELVGPGSLYVRDHARIGSPDRPGLLSLSGSATVTIDSNIYVVSNGSLSLNLHTTGTTMVARGGSLSGGLAVPQPSDMTIDEGDQFTLLKLTDAAPPTGEDRFELLMLPAVGENLGLELSYEGGGTAGYLTVKATAVTMDDLVEFDPPQTVLESGLAVDMVNADIDGDGADEVCVLYAGTPGTVGIYNSSTNGLVLQHTMDTGDGPKDITRGDFNGDGYQDLAVANTGDGDITVYYGAGSLNAFTTDTLYPSEGRPECISRADWDGTGADELVAGLRVTDTQDDDEGAFEIFTFSSNFGPVGGMGGGGANGSPGGVPQVFGDPSDDEDQKDLPFSAGDDHGNAVGGRGGSGLTSDMVFEIVQVGADITSLSMRDIDGDGEKDLVVAVASTDTLAIIKGGTNGSIETNNPVYLPAAGADPASLIAEDLNGDGKVDLAWIQTNDQGYRVMQIAQNNGDLTFTSLEAGTDPAHFLIAADITGSGTLDMLTVETDTSGLLGGFANLSLLEQTADTCLGDADGNGVVNIDDLLSVIGEFNNDCEAGDLCTSDFDGNGVINIDDLLIVIGAFGPC